MKKSCVIGCAALLIAVAALVGVLMMKAPQWWAQGKTFVLAKMAEEQRMSVFERAWTPRSPKPDASWAPATVGEWKLKQHETVTGWRELKVDRAGPRIIYEQGARTVEIGAIPATELEKPELVKRLTEAAEARGNTTTRKSIGNGSVTLNSSSNQLTTTLGNRTHLQAGGEHLRIWWLKDWLFFFRATDADPAEFAEEYLRAISAPEPELEPAAETRPDAL